MTRQAERRLSAVVALLYATAVGGCETAAAPPPPVTYTVQPSFAPAGGRLEASRHPDGLCLEAHFEGGEQGSGAWRVLGRPDRGTLRGQCHGLRTGLRLRSRAA